MKMSGPSESVRYVSENESRSGVLTPEYRCGFPRARVVVPAR